MAADDVDYGYYHAEHTGGSTEDPMHPESVKQMLIEAGEVCKKLEAVGRYLESLEFHVRALDLCKQEYGEAARETENKYLDIAELNCTIAAAQLDGGQVKEANSYLVALESLTAKHLRHGASNKRRLLYRARMFDLLAVLKQLNGKPLCGLRYAEKAAMIFLSLRGASDLPRSLLNLSALNSNLGLHGPALKYAFSALQAIKELIHDDPGAAPADAPSAVPPTSEGKHAVFSTPLRGGEAAADTRTSLEDLARELEEQERKRAVAEAMRRKEADILLIDPEKVQPQDDTFGGESPADEVHTAYARLEREQEEVDRQCPQVFGSPIPSPEDPSTNHDAPQPGAVHETAEFLGLLRDLRVQALPPSRAAGVDRDAGSGGFADAAWVDLGHEMPCLAALLESAYAGQPGGGSGNPLVGLAEGEAARHAMGTRDRVEGGSLEALALYVYASAGGEVRLGGSGGSGGGDGGSGVADPRDAPPEPVPQTSPATLSSVNADAQAQAHPTRSRPLQQQQQQRVFPCAFGSAQSAQQLMSPTILLSLAYYSIAAEQEHCGQFDRHVDTFQLALSTLQEDPSVTAEHPLFQKFRSGLRQARAAQRQRQQASQRGDAVTPHNHVVAQRRRDETRSRQQAHVAASLFTRRQQAFNVFARCPAASRDSSDAAAAAAANGSSAPLDPPRASPSRASSLHLQYKPYLQPQRTTLQLLQQQQQQQPPQPAESPEPLRSSQASPSRESSLRLQYKQWTSSTTTLQQQQQERPPWPSSAAAERPVRRKRELSSGGTRHRSPAGYVSPPRAGTRGEPQRHPQQQQQQRETAAARVERKRRQIRAEVERELLLADGGAVCGTPQADQQLAASDEGSDPKHSVPPPRKAAAHRAGHPSRDNSPVASAVAPVSERVRKAHDRVISSAQSNPSRQTHSQAQAARGSAGGSGRRTRCRVDGVEQTRQLRQARVVAAHDAWVRGALQEDMSGGHDLSPADVAFLSATFNLPLKNRPLGARAKGAGSSRRGEAVEDIDDVRQRMLKQRQEAAAWLHQLKQDPMIQAKP
ncbi:hypothetical protein DIPPA_30389 [Diplonema papillatum]|nr:hypothetical protein DIPPA_30389 [Diplonema papillatum]